MVYEYLTYVIYPTYANIFFGVASPFANNGAGSDIKKGRLTFGGNRLREHCFACSN